MIAEKGISRGVLIMSGKENEIMKITERIKENSQNPGKHRPIVIGFLGDSVTQGCFEIYLTGENSLETEVRSYEAYHSKLKRILEEIFPSVPINIINAGISGDLAPNGQTRLARDILEFSPDLVVVCFGLNDVCRGMKGLSDYAEALDGIFKELNDCGIETIFMTPNTIGTRAVAEERDPFIHSVLESITRFQIDGTMDAYMEKAREVCAENHIAVCDCYAKWKKLAQNGADTTRLLANRVNHPSQKMHWLFAVSLFEMIIGM